MFPKRCSSSRLDQIKLRVNQLIEYVNCTKWHSCVHFLLPSRVEAVLFKLSSVNTEDDGVKLALFIFFFYYY